MVVVIRPAQSEGESLKPVLRREILSRGIDMVCIYFSGEYISVLFFIRFCTINARMLMYMCTDI